MKLWLLRPHPGDPLWEPWYDKPFGFVVRAETEEQARALAQEITDGGGDFDRMDNRPPTLGESMPNAWTSPDHSTCEELTADGKPGIVMRDFARA